MTDTLEILAKILREEVERGKGWVEPVQKILMRVVVRLDVEVQQRHLDEALDDEIMEVMDRRDGGLDPDLAEALDIVSEHYNSMGRADIATAFRKGNCDTIPIMEIAITAIKRGRKLERAVMGNPIPEQIQEVTPPEPVNPDLAEAEAIWFEGLSPFDLALEGIKRGRALAAAEAKPGMVWVKHDGSEKSPVALGELVVVKYDSGSKTTLTVSGGEAKHRDWENITHYAIITPPTEDK